MPTNFQAQLEGGAAKAGVKLAIPSTNIVKTKLLLMIFLIIAFPKAKDPKNWHTIRAIKSGNSVRWNGFQSLIYNAQITTPDLTQRVNNVIFGLPARFPLYPPIATAKRTCREVSFVPIGDICDAATGN